MKEVRFIIQKQLIESNCGYKFHKIIHKTFNLNKMIATHASDFNSYTSSSKLSNEETLDWNVNFAALIEYAKAKGDCNVPEDFNFECDIISTSNVDKSVLHYQSNLGKWLQLQYVKFKNGGWNNDDMIQNSLFQELIAAGQLSWTVEERKRKRKDNDSWFLHFAAMEAYCQEHGDCNVPAKTEYECEIELEDEDGVITRVHYNGKLGSWLDRQRRYNKTNATSLTSERRRFLQAYVDCGKLNWSNHGGDKGSAINFKVWLRCYAALIEYGKIYGHANIPQRREFECMLPTNSSDIDSLTSHLLRDSTVTTTTSDSGYDYFLDAQYTTHNDCDQSYIPSLLSSECDYILSCLSEDENENDVYDNSAVSSPTTTCSDCSHMSEYTAVSSVDTSSSDYSMMIAGTNHSSMSTFDATRHYKGKLGKWLDHQRLAKKKRTLAPVRERLLNLLVFHGLFAWELNNSSTPVKRKRAD